jgi:hypothetical protein
MENSPLRWHQIIRFGKLSVFHPTTYSAVAAYRQYIKARLRAGYRWRPDITDLKKHFKPMDGFGGNPLDKESWWMMTESMALRAARYNIFNEVESFARENGLYNFAMNLVKGEDVERLLGTNYTERKATLATPLQKELRTAKILKKNGHKVFFTPENNKFLNYDAIINGRLGEFKSMESFNKIRKRLNEANRQRAAIVCLEPPTENHTVDAAIKEVQDWFKNSQHSIKYVDTVLLILEGLITTIKNNPCYSGHRPKAHGSSTTKD